MGRGGGAAPSKRCILLGGFPPRQYPIWPRKVARVAVRKTLQIVLMLGFRFPELPDRLDFRDHLPWPEAGGLDVGNGVDRAPALFVVVVVDGGAIACADVVALAVPGGRIMDLEEKLQDPPETDPLRVEDDLYTFGVLAVVAIGSVRNVAARIAHAGRDYAREFAKQILHSPETATCQNRAFGHRLSSTWSRYSPYPSASMSSRWMKRSAAELMQ